MSAYETFLRQSHPEASEKDIQFCLRMAEQLAKVMPDFCERMTGENYAS